MYFGYRYYSPETGRWLSREPLGEFESWNLYAYCHNDPINKVDRLGLDEIEARTRVVDGELVTELFYICLLYTSPSPRD